MFKWSPEYSVNLGSIDAQHQSMLAICRELSNAVSSGQSKKVTGRLLDRLIQFLTSHFAHEERLMRANGFAGYADHKAEHIAFAARLVELQKDLQADRAGITVELLNSMRAELACHIRTMDSQYAQAIHEKAIA